MIELEVRNPFNAFVYYEETVTSTMDVSRILANSGKAHGTVITADFQENGRGRGRGRSWENQRGLNLSFTLFLRYSCIEEIPKALTLRIGLAVSQAIEDSIPVLQNKVFIKWPNDIMIESKKAAGILCESEGGNVHIGIGINVNQKRFPSHLQEKATSIFLAANKDFEPESMLAETQENCLLIERYPLIERYLLLEKILDRIYCELGSDKNSGKNEDKNSGEWKTLLEKKLYKKGEKVVFYEGAADSGKKVEGYLTGITDDGELLILPDTETQARSFITGELKEI